MNERGRDYQLDWLVHNSFFYKIKKKNYLQHKLEEDMTRKHRQVSKLELSVKKLTEELVKGNEIIKKLQGDMKNYHTKVGLNKWDFTKPDPNP